MILYRIVLFIILNLYGASTFAWLIAPAQWRYSVGINNIDYCSKDRQQRRADRYLQVQQQLETLRNNIKSVNNSSALYKSLLNQIQILERESSTLPSYQDSMTSTFTVEYGVSDNQNFGVQFLYKENKFQDSKDINFISNTKQINLFSKIKLLQKNNFITLIQPKIFVTKDTDCKQQFFGELSLLLGYSKVIRPISIVTDSAFSVGHYLSDKSNKKIYCTFSVSEGIKFKNDLMLVYFTKYYFRRNYGLIYDKTLYRQFSIVKQIKFANLKQNRLTMQIGYFEDQSLTNREYKISGATFSIWLDI